MSSLHRPKTSVAPLIAVCILAAIFLFWIFSVVAPIIGVELTYQYKSFLQNTFGVTDIRGLILPQFKVDLAGFTGTYRVDGISIPAVFIDEPVIYNVDPNNPAQYLEALKHGIAQASSTSFPGNGGLGYYFAHSSTPEFALKYNAVFYLLYKLHTGDAIYLWHNGQRYDYAVISSIITSPNDLSFLHTTYPTETIVLQTCWPPGTSLERLLVFAQRSQ